jgi:phosphate transport system substrate-binding protein
MKNSPLSIPDEFRSCRWCGYDGNSISARVCEVCNQALWDKASPTHKSKGANKLISWLPIVLLGLGAIPVLVGGVGYWKWRQQEPVAKTATNISSAPDIKLYPTIKVVPNVPKGLFNYQIALNFAPIMAHGMHEAINQAHPEFQLRYTEPLHGNPGSATAIRMLIDGEVSFAQSARPVEDAEFDRARARNVSVEQIPVAIDAVAVYTHPGIKISGLSIDQVQNIYLGKITNWKQLGGPNVSIVPFSLDPKATSAAKFVLGDDVEKMSSKVRLVRDATDAVRQVSTTRGAIAFGGSLNAIGQKSIRVLNLAKANSTKYVSLMTKAGVVNNEVVRNGIYPLTRRNFIVIRRNGGPDERAGVAYANVFLSGEGQRILENAGFVPLY